MTFYDQEALVARVAALSRKGGDGGEETKFERKRGGKRGGKGNGKPGGGKGTGTGTGTGTGAGTGTGTGTGTGKGTGTGTGGGKGTGGKGDALKGYKHKAWIDDQQKLYAAIDDFQVKWPDLCVNYNLRVCKQGAACQKTHEVPPAAEAKTFSDEHSLGLSY